MGPRWLKWVRASSESDAAGYEEPSVKSPLSTPTVESTAPFGPIFLVSERPLSVRFTLGSLILLSVKTDEGRKMETNGPETLLLRTRSSYGRELETYARLEFPTQNFHWVGKSNRADLSGILSADLPKSQATRSRLAKLWLALRPTRGHARSAPDVALPRVAAQLEATGHENVRLVRSTSAVPLAVLGTAELRPEFGIHAYPISASPAFRGTYR